MRRLLTLGQEWSGYEGMLADDLDRNRRCTEGGLPPGARGTAVGTGINSAPGFGRPPQLRLPSSQACVRQRAEQVHGAGRSRPSGSLSGTLRTLAVSLYKIANDISG